MRVNLTERVVVCGLSALTGASWFYCTAAFFHSPLALALAAAIAGAALVGGGMRYRYRGRHPTSVETTEEARPPVRWAVTLGMGMWGAFFGFTVPRQLFPNLDWAMFVAPSLTLAFFMGSLGWRHPALFFKNRGS